jgi:hypothetical protein
VGVVEAPVVVVLDDDEEENGDDINYVKIVCRFM